MERPLHIFWGRFSKQLFFGANVSRRTLPYDSFKRDSTTDVFRNMFYFFFGTAISQNSSVRLHARKLIFVWLAKWLFCGRVVQEHGDILNSSNNSMFLLQKSIEIGKCLISSASREFEWSPKGKSQNLLAQILWLLPEHW